MKKLIIILLLPFVLSAGNFGVTGRFGINLSGTLGEDSKISGFTRSPEPGILTAVGVDYLHRQVGVGGELLYSQKGVRYMQAESIGVTANLDYLETALFALYTIPVSDLRCRLHLGLAPSFLLKSSAEYHINGDTAPQELRGIRDFDLGLILGAGLGKSLGTGSLFFDLRGTLGLITNDSSGNEKDYNGVLTLSMLYRFPIEL